MAFKKIKFTKQDFLSLKINGRCVPRGNYGLTVSNKYTITNNENEFINVICTQNSPIHVKYIPITVLELALELDFKEDYNYYDYIVSSIINGQKKQAKSLYLKLQENDKEKARNFIKEEHYNHYQKFLETII